MSVFRAPGSANVRNLRITNGLAQEGGSFGCKPLKFSGLGSSITEGPYMVLDSAWRASHEKQGNTNPGQGVSLCRPVSAVRPAESLSALIPIFMACRRTNHTAFARQAR